MKMRELLCTLPAGLPADTLLARIKGRRAFLVPDWERLLMAPTPLAALAPAPWRSGAAAGAAGIAQALQQEYYWVFARMEEELRTVTAPFFWLEEIRTLATAIRLTRAGGTEQEHLLAASLLTTPLRAQLRQAEDAMSALTGVTKLLAEIEPAFAALPASYRRDGAGALEAALTEISLQRLVHTPLPRQLRNYCALLIDSRNLTTIAKRLRWRLDTLPPLLAGGTLAGRRLRELFNRRDHSGLLRLAMRLGGQAPYPENADLEAVLHQAQGRVLRRLARAEDGIGALLHYLWCCRNEAANIALLQRLETAGSAAVGKELRR